MNTVVFYLFLVNVTLFYVFFFFDVFTTTMNLEIGRRLLPERLQNVDGTTVSEILACGLRLLYHIV